MRFARKLLSALAIALAPAAAMADKVDAALPDYETASGVSGNVSSGAPIPWPT